MTGRSGILSCHVTSVCCGDTSASQNSIMDSRGGPAEPGGNGATGGKETISLGSLVRAPSLYITIDISST